MTIKSKARRRPATSISKRPTIALLTDFGLTDHYVGVMKGVLASKNPDVRIIDISHEVQPHSVHEAGYLLWASYRYFPQGTIFVVVVDPGVGSNRNILIFKSASYVFLAPDNGVLNFVEFEEKNVRCYELGMEKVRLLSKSGVLSKNISSTFQGRDVFAPIAAILSLGERPDRFGELKERPSLSSPFYDVSGSSNMGRVLHVDRFGNIVTNIRGEESGSAGRIKEIVISGRRIDRWVKCYSEAPEETPVLILGSNGLTEISLKNAHAGRVLDARPGLPVRVIK